MIKVRMDCITDCDRVADACDVLLRIASSIYESNGNTGMAKIIEAVISLDGDADYVDNLISDLRVAFSLDD